MKLGSSTLTAIALHHDRTAAVAVIEAPAPVTKIGAASHRGSHADAAQPTDQAAAKAHAASEALATLEAVRHSGKDGGKARAAAKIAELQTRLHLLKLLYATDSEKLAQAAVQIARELAAAVQEYVGSGGTAYAVQGVDITTIVGGANLTPAPAPAEDMPPQDPVTTGTTAEADAKAIAIAADTDARKSQSEPAHHDDADHLAESASDVSFANEVRALANELRAILTHAEHAHRARDHEAAKGELNDIDRATAAMTRMPAAYDATVARAVPASGAATIFVRG